MLWLCLHFPRLPLEVFTRGAAAEGPFAVSAGKGSRRQILMASPAAAAVGIRPGMTLGAAHAHASGLAVRERDEPAEAAALANLASWAGQFTPLVSLSPSPFPAVLLEVEGSGSLFQGLERLLAVVEKGVAGLGYRSVLALAPTPLAAEFLARAGRGGERVSEIGALEESLSPLPLRVLGLSAQALETLGGMGLRTLGSCLGLPRAGLARRFGQELLEILDRALGKVPDPRPAFSPPPRFESRLELAAEVRSSGALLFALQRLLSELEGFLRARGKGVRGLRLDLCHRERDPTRIELGLAAPRSSTRHLLGLLRERLERVVLPEPVSGLRLTAPALSPLRVRSPDLFSEDAFAQAEDGSHLLERFQARLGVGSVRGLRLAPEHRPERAGRLCPPQEESESAARFGERPLWLLPEPAPLGTRPAARLSGRPVGLTLLAGPERIESGWWDGSDVARDYYVAEDSRGSRLWVFRERRGEGQWFVHGIFG